MWRCLGMARWLLRCAMVAIAIFVPPHCCKAETESLGPTTLTPEAIELHFSPEIGYSFRTVVGGQELSLKVMSNLEGIVLFQTGSSACPSVPSAARCYDPRSSSTAVWCNNNDVCVPGKTDFHCDEVDSPEKIPTSTTTEFRSDGIGHAMESIEGFEAIEIRNSALAAPVKFDRVPVKLASKVAKGGAAPWTLTVDGFFGLAGSTISCRQSSIWSEILSKYDGYYVIDLHGTTSDYLMRPEVPSRIILGPGFAEQHEVMWAEKRQSGGIFTDASLEFTAYEMSMCKVNLFGRTSNHWQVTIDMNSQCLVLPKNFWFSLMAQLPIVEGCYDKQPPKMCQLRRDNVADLPLIEFKLQQQSGGQVLRIPLQKLLLDDSSTPTLCIVPDEDTASPPIFTNQPTIKFGYRVLESLPVVVDTRGHRIGFVNKVATSTGDSICLGPTQCVGNQVHVPELNYCLQPFCSIWAFKRLDPETGRCVTSRIAILALYVISSVFVVAEFRRYVARRNIFELARRLF